MSYQHLDIEIADGIATVTMNRPDVLNGLHPESHAEMERHSHQITNCLIELNGNTATSESYVTVLLWRRPSQSGERTEIVARGRYLDRWSFRDGRWAIDHRTTVTDTQTINTLAKAQHGPPQGTRDASDPSFEFIPKA